MAKQPLGANKIIRGYGQTVWKSSEFKGLGIVASYGVYSAAINRFINLNYSGFNFLGLNVLGEQEFANELRINRSRYCGVVPLISAANGKSIGDLSVLGAYGEDIAEIVAAIGHNVTVEFNSNLILTGTSCLTPPIYLECLRYIELFIEASKSRWTKFEVVNKTESRVRGITDWNRYAAESVANPRDALKFHNRFNSLSTAHAEWENLIAILRLTIQIATAPTVPVNARLKVSTKLRSLLPRLHGAENCAPVEPTSHASDPLIIKQLKESGKLILNAKSAWRCAWRVDQALLFEEYVQFICESALRRLGGTLTRNPHIKISGFYSPWTLAYLEPDAVAKVGEMICIIDAKYKSHMFNSGVGEQSELNENFRHDLHQILAYSSFAPNLNSSTKRSAVLVYPNAHFKVYRQSFYSDVLLQTDVELYLVGMPFNSAAINDNVARMQDFFRSRL